MGPRWARFDLRCGVPSGWGRGRRPRCDEPVLLTVMRFQSLCARPQRLLRSAQRRFLNNGGPPPVEPRGPGSTAERSMQPLRRFRILGLKAGSKAFARGRKWPRTEPAALVHRVPAALDPTNVGLHVVDVVRNEIIHRNHLHPESVGQLIYRNDETDRNGSKDLLLVHQGARCRAHRASYEPAISRKNDL
jgi:hypothetical protein